MWKSWLYDTISSWTTWLLIDVSILIWYYYEDGKWILHCQVGQLGCRVRLEVVRLECCRWFSVAPSGNNEHLFIWMFIPPLFMCNQTTPDCTDDDIIAMTQLFDWMIVIPHFHCRKTPEKVTKYDECSPLEFRLYLVCLKKFDNSTKCQEEIADSTEHSSSFDWKKENSSNTSNITFGPLLARRTPSCKFVYAHLR